jgi:hypothetical protein
MAVTWISGFLQTFSQQLEQNKDGNPIMFPQYACCCTIIHYIGYLVQFVDNVNHLLNNSVFVFQSWSIVLLVSVPHRLSIWSNLHNAAYGLYLPECSLIISRLKQDPFEVCSLYKLQIKIRFLKSRTQSLPTIHIKTNHLVLCIVRIMPITSTLHG